LQDPNEAFECRSTLIWISGLIIREKLDAFLEAGMELGYFVDGTVAQDSTQASSFWEIREGISEALVKAGAVYKYDLSLPIKSFYRIVEDLRAQLGEESFRCFSPYFLFLLKDFSCPRHLLALCSLLIFYLLGFR
jgi:FAD/FMN-containing dehydrogenase